MTAIDITPYIQEGQYIDLAALLKESGFVRKEDVLGIRIDTTAIAQLLRISQKTLYKYINDGFIKLDNGRRMTLGDALSIDFQKLKQQAKAGQPVRHKRQKRKPKTK